MISQHFSTERYEPLKKPMTALFNLDNLFLNLLIAVVAVSLALLILVIVIGLEK